MNEKVLELIGELEQVLAGKDELITEHEEQIKTLKTDKKEVTKRIAVLKSMLEE